jgi:hypothetical protein
MVSISYWVFSRKQFPIVSAIRVAPSPRRKVIGHAFVFTDRRDLLLAAQKTVPADSAGMRG